MSMDWWSQARALRRRAWMASAWVWSVVIMLSAVGAGVVNALNVHVSIRAPIVLWFLFICPGMAYVRLLRLKQYLVEWVLAIALSLALDLIVASMLLYAGRWSPSWALLILIGLSSVGALLTVVPFRALKI
jgi:hypothetical protein